jgi:tyrosine-protein kinase Etk/Wzc
MTKNGIFRLFTKPSNSQFDILIINMGQTMTQPDRANRQTDPAEEIHLLDYWQVVKKRRKVIFSVTFIAVAAAAIISLLMAPTYQAKTTLLAVESSQTSFATALGALQNLPFLGGMVSGSLGKTTTDKLVSILNSRTVAETVVKKLDLTPIIFKNKWDEKKGAWNTDKPPTLQDTLKTLQQDMVRITNDRKGLIAVSVEYKNPKIAADIANEYPIGLQKFLNENSISLAKRNRIFLGKQLETTKVDLKKAEEDLRSFQTEKKLAVVDAQAESSIKASAELKAQIIAREVQLGALREFATRANPDVKRIEDEIRELRQQLERMEKGSKNRKGEESIGAFIPLSEAPTVGLEYARLKRDVLIQQKVFELLTQQFELAKIEEAKDDVAFQVIDAAISPEKKLRPKIAQNIALTAVVSLFLSIFLVFFLEYVDRQKGKK